MEKSLQSLIEKHLDFFLGVRFLASDTEKIQLQTAEAKADTALAKDRNQAQRIRQIDDETQWATYQTDSTPVENTRWKDATQYQADYHDAIATADAEKMLAYAEASKTRIWI